MKNVTISMDEALADWVRVAAAKKGLSVSKYLAELAEEKRRADSEYQRAMESFFSRGPYDLGFNDRAPTREEIYEERFRRYERAGVREGSAEPFQTEESAGLADGPNQRKGDGD